ncbi:hypothetical protein PTTG_02326 [Puccinia triticina 1-1 BBBD Race 1]|uniref:Uncharacterized protein n=1 Tax=Puccinia triticina (isolate 1-1 / race 1 (BBBD)) TaxID=630390 RepID=A0A0C4ENH9_PUCT1|nr:hypothetical protein PTTG_02326 [Puccinia triticina 1-1 BBBD Race 1]
MAQDSNPNPSTTRDGLSGGMGPDAAAPQFASKFGVFLSSSFVSGFYSSSHFLGGTGYAFLDIRFLGGTGNGSLPSEFSSSFTCSWP